MKRVIILFIIALMALPGFVALAQGEPTETPDPDIDIEVEVDEDAVEEAAEDVVEVTQEVADDATGTIQDLIDDLTEIPNSDVARLLMVIAGVILLVAAWRLYDFVVIISGIIVGASLAVSLVTGEEELVQILALLMGGIIGALLAVFVYYIAVFFIGGHIGILLTAALAESLELEPVSAVALAVGGIIGGIVALGLSAELLVILAVLVGAEMIVIALGLAPVWIIILTIVGIVIQLFASRYYGYPVRRRPRSLRSLF